MVRRVLLTLILASSTLGAAPVPKGLSPPILVVLKTGRGAQLVLLDGGGRNSKTLTDDESNASYPAWSPDGGKIAFCSDRTGGVGSVEQLFLMNADGKNTRQLTRGEFPSRMPSWSPDGKTLLFCRAAPGGGSRIFSVPAAGGEAEAVGDGDGWDPAWSPDGKKIAFCSVRDGGEFRLYVMDADGKNVKELARDNDNPGKSYPAWSHDGKVIAYGHYRNGEVHISTVNADGTNSKQLTRTPGSHAFPNWSADDKQILFLALTEAGKADIAAVDIVDESLSILVKDVGYAPSSRPQWRPTANAGR